MIETIPEDAGDIFLIREEEAIERGMSGVRVVGCSAFMSGIVVQPDQAEGAVARKNLSRSRLANRSCSWWVSGRESPPS